MSEILDQIVAATRARLEREPADLDALHRDAAARRSFRPPHTFAAELRAAAPRIIAEVKCASPSAGPIVENPDVEAIAGEYRRGGAAAISVVTEPEFFRGSRAWLARASTVGLPVIMKDFIVEERQLLEGIAAGADAILLLASLLDGPRIRALIVFLDLYGVDALVEVHDEGELERAIAGGARLIGVNNRDLRSFRVDLATSERLAPLIPGDAIRVAESGIRSGQDVDRLVRAGYGAFLVGESLLRQNDRAAAVRALLECGPAASESITTEA
jgi:indole-3-glycerol phosphate synthase